MKLKPSTSETSYGDMTCRERTDCFSSVPKVNITIELLQYSNFGAIKQKLIIVEMQGKSFSFALPVIELNDVEVEVTKNITLVLEKDYLDDMEPYYGAIRVTVDVQGGLQTVQSLVQESPVELFSSGQYELTMLVTPVIRTTNDNGKISVQGAPHASKG